MIFFFEKIFRIQNGIEMAALGGPSSYTARASTSHPTRHAATAATHATNALVSVGQVSESLKIVLFFSEIANVLCHRWCR
jgi:hypothetical protein